MMAHIFYWAGSGVAIVMRIWPMEFLHPYPLYNWLMGKSVAFDKNSRIWKPNIILCVPKGFVLLLVSVNP